jgi:hypothetical protein
MHDKRKSRVGKMKKEDIYPHQHIYSNISIYEEKQRNVQGFTSICRNQKNFTRVRIHISGCMMENWKHILGFTFTEVRPR